ncbi:uncharacterized protein LOC108028676 [Drosophila biarmipes]|uniref:uncharacterized protein LOC108028676 n=1 Tax=Drosophila biarmipes TaxID=125945 RepID=UPI0007E68FF4|nr:uncharacterized protein LOC108028676 [Drosophila biarmipes]XP_016956101.1 uncharacterized protein LOC108028676 [Drosophila biarmipes]XP_016956102.1 uncharacterized protein LOC108028676 [Drosophila biarmipes]XP_050742019.1 uncharacterized protein LOC108028676 [Drosophila biarmipes]
MAAIAALPTAPLRRNNTSKGIKSRRNERNILTFYEKIAVIRYYEETNISRNSLAKMFHCCATQIRRILDKKKELLQQLATLSEADASIIIEEMTRKRRKFEMSAISFLLHEWVERCTQLHLNISIRNQKLKETAIRMAAVLNLPSFRPSYRWLNRFRGKYKYEADELGYQGENPVSQDLPVEDIIVEFKHALPNFMQRELAEPSGAVSTVPLAPDFVNLSSENSLMSDHLEEDDGVEMVTCEPTMMASPASPPEEEEQEEVIPPPEGLENADDQMNAGTSTLLNGVFPHLAIIHQFALMNSDVQALELISQLGVHMQQQAVSGAYRGLSLATTGGAGDGQTDLGTNSLPELPPGSIYADIDDIELIE